MWNFHPVDYSERAGNNQTFPLSDDASARYCKGDLNKLDRAIW